MKIYKFDIDSYGDYWIVLASSAEEALVKLQDFMKHNKYCKREYLEWKDATLDNLPPQYSVVVEDDVIGGNYS